MAASGPLEPEWVWGVDISTTCIDFAFVHRDGSYQLNGVRPPPKLRAASRLAHFHRSTREFAAACGHHFPPLIVYLEQPTGAHPNPSLDHTTGIAMAAIWEGLSTLYPYPVSVVLVAVSDWKKKIGLAGNAGKPEVAAWARDRGHHGGQDQADALGVAACAAVECDFGPGPVNPRVFA